MIENNAKFSGQELRIIFRKENCKNIKDDTQIIGVSIDTRKIANGNLFIPLKGENTDGNELIIEAFDRGAICSFVERSYYEQNEEELKMLPLIVVENTLEAIGILANFHRKRFDIPIIAIGGSNGKTTTKEILSHILSLSYNVLKTYKNYNNQLGVPLMLLSLDETYNVAVLEIATNEPGEIAILSEILEPTHGLITNIGKEHLEKLIDIVGVETEETYLFGHLRKFNKKSFINYDDPILQKYANLLDNKYVFGQMEGMHMTFGVELDDELHPTISIKTYDEKKLEVKMSESYGKIQAYNAAAAIAICIELGVDENQIVRALKNFKSENSNGYSRMLVEKVNGLTIINDCYNANPNSMNAALDTLSLFENEKVAVLGDMLELGETAVTEHKQIVEKASEIADKVLLYGNIFSGIEMPENCSHYTDKKRISEIISQFHNTSAVLIKGSRGMRLEEIIIELKSKLN